MKAGEAIAEILKREGVEIIFGYPVNHILEYAARAGIRPIIVRQERIGLHMADALSRLTSGQKLGVFAMQHGPGAENAFGGVAQAYGEAVPILVLPQGYPRRIAFVPPNFNSVLNMRGVTKSAEPILSGAEIPNIFRRAFTRLKSGRGGPVLIEVPADIYDEEVSEPLAYTPATMPRVGPDPEAVRTVAKRLAAAKRPVIYAGQGVHYARAWAELKQLAELLAAPVTTSLGGKSAFPEDHMLSLGSGGNAIPAPVHHFLQNADLIFGIGCSFTKTNFGVDMPSGKAIIHATLDPMDVNKDVACEQALIGDARLILRALLDQVEPMVADQRDPAPVADEIKAVREPWLAEWRPKLTSDETPLNPYRVLWDLAHTVDPDNVIITHDAGSPRRE
jgi:acetolactate synthase-1/2/3 large subunit